MIIVTRFSKNNIYFWLKFLRILYTSISAEPKILQARLQQYMNSTVNSTMNLQMFKLVLEKAEEPEIKLPTSAGSSKKQESSRKASISALLT